MGKDIYNTEDFKGKRKLAHLTLRYWTMETLGGEEGYLRAAHRKEGGKASGGKGLVGLAG